MLKKLDGMANTRHNPATRNEPANILTSIKAIAEIKDISVEEVLEAVCENSRNLYGDL